MSPNELRIDTVNLKKLAPMPLVIGAMLAIMISVGFYISGLWGVLLTAAWAFCGGYYAETLWKAGEKSEIANLGLNGAIMAAIAAVVYDVLSGIIFSIQTQSMSSLFSVSLFLQAAILGALAAIVWNVIKTNQNKPG